jgi:hypothetical protein
MHSIHNPWGVATLLFLVLFFPCVGIFAAIRNRRALAIVKTIGAALGAMAFCLFVFAMLTIMPEKCQEISLAIIILLSIFGLFTCVFYDVFKDGDK